MVICRVCFTFKSLICSNKNAVNFFRWRTYSAYKKILTLFTQEKIRGEFFRFAHAQN